MNISNLDDESLRGIIKYFDIRTFMRFFFTCKRFTNTVPLTTVVIKKLIFGLNFQKEKYIGCDSRCNSKIVEEILKDKYALVDPVINNNLVLKRVSAYGYDKVLKLLLDYNLRTDTGSKKVDPTVNNNEAIITASVLGRDKVVKLLLDYNPPAGYKRADPTANDNKAISEACRRGHYKVVKLLLDYDPPEGYNKINFAVNYSNPILEACRWGGYLGGHIDVIKLLMKDERVDISSIRASQIQHCSPKIINLFLRDGRIDPSIDNNYFVIRTSKYGHSETLKLLLNYRSNISGNFVDPTAGNNQAVIEASRNGNSKIVELLLGYIPPLNAKRVDPTDQNNEAIISACLHGQREGSSDYKIESRPDFYKIVNLLLNYTPHPNMKKVDPTARNNSAIILALGGRRTKDGDFTLEGRRGSVSYKIANLLLNYVPEPHLNMNKVDPSDQNNYAIRNAAASGLYKVVEMLLNYVPSEGMPEVDPSADNNFAIRKARENGYGKIVKLLLKNKKVNPSKLSHREFFKK
ncbi:ankyrin repeat domain-containing protein [bacterium]|nr:ankyrin repeat domain-containing protein [bacterium]